MTFNTILLMTVPMAVGQDPDTPKRPSQVDKIEPFPGGNNENLVIGGIPGGKTGTPFKPGQVKVDDTRGTETGSGGSPGGTGGSVFKPGQVKVDETRGTEVKPPIPQPAVYTPPAGFSMDVAKANSLSYPPPKRPYDRGDMNSESYYIARNRPKNEAFVKQLYQMILGRDGSPGEISGWSSRLDSGESADMVLAEFLISDEFNQKYPMSNEEFVKNVYRIYLRREADPEGIAGWSGKVNSGELSRKDLIKNILQSAEFRNNVLLPRLRMLTR